MSQIAVEVRTFVTEGPMRIDNGTDEAAEEDVVESPYRSGLDLFRETFISNTKDLVFRLVESVTVSEEDRYGTVLNEPNADGTINSKTYKPTEEPVFTSKQEEQNVERHASKFFCMTKDSSLRPGTFGERNVKSQKILLKSDNYGQLDIFNNMDFKFSTCSNTVLPVKGDIACILPKKTKGQGPEARYWFICSPQFLRTWTLIHFKEHDVIKKLAPDEESVRRKVFSGNTTMTNSYLSWLVSCYHNNLFSEEEELRTRYWNLRTEYASRAYVHVYSALVLMLRYAECPGQNNIPNKLDKSPKLLEWNLPAGWLQNLFEKYELVLHPDPAIRFIEVPTRGLEIPKGTRLMFPVAAADPRENCPTEKSVTAEHLGEISDFTPESGGNWGDCVVEEN